MGDKSCRQRVPDANRSIAEGGGGTAGMVFRYYLVWVGPGWSLGEIEEIMRV